LDVAPILKISRAKETRTKISLREGNLSKCLGDRRLSSSRKTIQPKHTVVLFILQPTFKLQEDTPPRSPQAPLPVPRTMSGFNGVMHVVQKDPVNVSLFTSYFM
jgi:hypothetical protein